MRYERIFTDIKTEGGFEKPEFLRMTIYAPRPSDDETPVFGAPYLIHIEAGDKRMEDWDTRWIIRPYTLSEAKVIRDVISILDSSPLPAPIEAI